MIRNISLMMLTGRLSSYQSNVKSQCMAYDFVFSNGNPLVLEISYGFAAEGYDACEGFWDRSMNWNEGRFNPYGWMVDDLLSDIADIKSSKTNTSVQQSL
jgi:hypothetical protein